MPTISQLTLPGILEDNSAEFAWFLEGIQIDGRMMFSHRLGYGREYWPQNVFWCQLRNLCNEVESMIRRNWDVRFVGHLYHIAPTGSRILAYNVQFADGEWRKVDITLKGMG